MQGRGHEREQGLAHLSKLDHVRVVELDVVCHLTVDEFPVYI